MQKLMHHVNLRAAAFMLMILALLYAGTAKAQTTIIVTPGENIAAVINAAPQNAVISIQPGVYFVDRSINPKAGQTITGNGDGVILTGARTLTAWNRDSAGRWYVTGQTQQGKRTTSPDWTVCSQGYPRCNYPEDVFVNRVPLRHMGALADVKARCACYFFDYDANTITIGDDPTGRLVQTSVTPQAITSSATNVKLSNFTVEMFASPTQDGALQANGNDWHLSQITATLNHGAGVLLRGTSSMRDGDTSLNGGLGWKIVGLNGGQAVDTVIDHNVCNFNNYARVDQYFEAGCSKAVRTTRLRVTNNTVIGNIAKGLWTDIDNRETYYGSNYIEANLSNGIYHEISQSAIIEKNTLICNGTGGTADGGYYSAINATNTVDVLIRDNYIEVCERGNGISIRGDGSRPTYPSDRNTVVNNTIISVNGRGRLLEASTVNNGTIGAYTFSGNVSYVQNPNYYHWGYDNRVWQWDGWAARWPGEQRVMGLPSTPTPEPIPPTVTATPTPTASGTPQPEIATNTPTQVQVSPTPEMTPVTPFRLVIKFGGEFWIEVQP